MTQRLQNLISVGKPYLAVLAKELGSNSFLSALILNGDGRLIIIIYTLKLVLDIVKGFCSRQTPTEFIDKIYDVLRGIVAFIGVFHKF